MIIAHVGREKMKIRDVLQAILDGKEDDIEVVVRCKDCKYWSRINGRKAGFCEKTRVSDRLWGENDWCSYGENWMNGRDSHELRCEDAEMKTMDDLISRQAAIDAFEDTTFTKNEIRRRLLEVPSAQPESEHTMEEFMYGQDLGSPEDGSL